GICHRISEVRRSRNWSLADFAFTVGISKDRLASYEHARARVRTWLAVRVCQAFNVSAVWLATEKGKQTGFRPLSQEFLEQIDQQRLFSEVFDEVIGPFETARKDQRFSEWNETFMPGQRQIVLKEYVKQIETSLPSHLHP